MSSDLQTHRNSRNLARVSSFGYREGIADQLAVLTALAAAESCEAGQRITLHSSSGLQTSPMADMARLPLGLRRPCLSHRLQ